MSKAFTREDDAPELPVVARRTSSLPPGTQNLMTPGGERQLRAELEELRREHERLRAQPDDPDRAQKISALEQRALRLDDCLRTAVVVGPPAARDGVVRFGATVTVREADGTETRHRIVGADEADFERGWVSWRSPIANALLNRAIGQRVRLRVPGGERHWEILRVDYE